MDTRAIDLIEAIAERLETVLGTFARDAEGAGSVRRLTPRSFGQTASARAGVTTSRANLACRLFQRTSAPRFPIVESDARVDADGRSSPRRWRCASAIGVETQNLYALTTARLVRPHSSHAGLSHASDSFEIDLVRKGGFEPPRSCERQPLKLEAVNADRSRPRKIGVGCPSSLPIEALSSCREQNVLQILAKGLRERIDLFTRLVSGVWRSTAARQAGAGESHRQTTQ